MIWAFKFQHEGDRVRLISLRFRAAGLYSKTLSPKVYEEECQWFKLISENKEDEKKNKDNNNIAKVIMGGGRGEG